ncbi:hypothetical protein [Butyrivibrio sp. MC2013]|uniref:hypothetical protein n=1 Tax=Butyrivibrio sp. MC2013 TaxID=1280686 RepID=UPI00040AE17C|nr:hypothetical protein [Butyrivibrio sp. MC2013]
MSGHEEAYKSALAGKNIPIVTADDKWKLLFGEEGATPEINAMAKELDELIDRQSMYKQKIRDIKRLKKTLLDEVIVLSDKLNSGDKSAGKELDDHKRLVKDCNSEMEELEESLIGLPTAIYELNFKLMLASMEVCYDKLHANTERINEIDSWLYATRKELKKQVIRLQEGETENFNLYSYMHQIFGPEVLDIFDMAYDPEREHRVRTTDLAD